MRLVVTRRAAGSRDASFLLKLRSGQFKNSSDQAVSPLSDTIGQKKTILLSHRKRVHKADNVGEGGVLQGFRTEGLTTAEEAPPPGWSV